MIHQTLFFLFSFFPLFLGAIEPFSFQTLGQLEHSSTQEIVEKLQPWNGQEVALRGFIYKIDDEWVLSSQPAVKSCCRDKQPLTQLIFLGTNLTIPDGTSIGDIQGILTILPETKQLLHLEGAHFLPTTPFKKENIVILIITIFIIVIFIIKIRVKLTSN